MRQGQVTMEFTIYLLVALTLLGSVILYTRSHHQQQQEDLEYAVLEDFALSLQAEFFSASTMHEGFERVITLPERLNQKSYSVSVLNNNLYVKQGAYEFILPLPIVGGTIGGENITLKTEEGKVMIQ